MIRKPNTDKNGYAWTEGLKKEIWRKGKFIAGHDPNILRSDICGAAMMYSKHGDRESPYGWEIDHINPVANGGGDNPENLQPLYWKNNADKADKLNWKCS